MYSFSWSAFLTLIAGKSSATEVSILRQVLDPIHPIEPRIGGEKIEAEFGSAAFIRAYSRLKTQACILRNTPAITLSKAPFKKTECCAERDLEILIYYKTNGSVTRICAP
jgi:hypothetical protein